jgi:hypothetical protein
VFCGWGILVQVALLAAHLNGITKRVFIGTLEFLKLSSQIEDLIAVHEALWHFQSVEADCFRAKTDKEATN